MKKFVTVLVVLTALMTSLGVDAQESKLALGGGLNYGTEIDNVGISLLGLYVLTDQWEAAPGFTLFLEKDYTKLSSLDLNGHYVFSNNGSNAFYAVGGLNVTFFKWEMGGNAYQPEEEYSEYSDYEGWGDLYSDLLPGLYSDLDVNETYIGLNLGAGARIKFNDNFSGLAELKYTVGELDYMNLGVGVLYHF